MTGPHRPLAHSPPLNRTYCSGREDVPLSSTVAHVSITQSKHVSICLCRPTDRTAYSAHGATHTANHALPYSYLII